MEWQHLNKRTHKQLLNLGNLICLKIIASDPSLTKPKSGKIQTLHGGIYQWQITFSEDGQNQLGGIVPLIIQWHSKAYHAQILSPSDIRLSNIEALHPNCNF